MTPRTVAGEYTRDGGEKGAERLTIQGQAAQWGTPRASDATHGGPNMAFSSGGIPLPAQAAQWPTPAARADTQGDADLGAIQRREEIGKQLHLAHIARLFSRPAPAIETHGPTLSQLRPIWHPLRASVTASHGRATWRRLTKGRKRRLNPGFVEWLMGWPPGHALCDCSGTEFALWRQAMRFALSQLPTASGPWIWKEATTEPAPQQLTFL